MNQNKIINFNDERYDRVADYTPFKCSSCSLTTSQKIDTCMSGCYDNIVEEVAIRKNEIEIVNVLLIEKEFQRRVKEILELFDKQ